MLWAPGCKTSVSPHKIDRPTGRQKQCVWKRKRVKRASVQARLKTNPSRPPLTSIFLANVRSIDSKLDYSRLLLTSRRDMTNCCALIFTDTWLYDSIPDSTIQLARLAKILLTKTGVQTCRDTSQRRDSESQDSPSLLQVGRSHLLIYHYV